MALSRNYKTVFEEFRQRAIDGKGHMTLKDISQFCSFDSLVRGSRHGFAAGRPYAGAMYNPTQPYVLLDRRLFTQPGAK